MMNLFLDFLFPRRSLTGVDGAFLTAEESGRLKAKPFVEDKAALQERSIFYLDEIRAAMLYHDSSLVQKAVRTFKYHRIPGLGEDLARLIVEGGGSPEEGSVLCPVPLHWSRHYNRGFNQAELLAHLVSVKTGIPMHGLLKRKRATGHQAHRGRVERLTALRDAFVCTDQTVPDHIILIDDLATTGATLDACAAALKEAGAKRVTAWVVAHG